MLGLINGYKTYIGVCLLAVAKALVDFSATDAITDQTTAIYVMTTLGTFLATVGVAHKLAKLAPAVPKP